MLLYMSRNIIKPHYVDKVALYENVLYIKAFCGWINRNCVSVLLNLYCKYTINKMAQIS